MDQEGDLQHCRMWQVLQRPHHLPVRPGDLGRGAHAGEAPRPRRLVINRPHSPTLHQKKKNLPMEDPETPEEEPRHSGS